MRFKYFQLPPELRNLIDEEAAKEEMDSAEWMNGMVKRLAASGLSRDQMSTVMATKLPSVNSSNSKRLLDYVEDLIAGKLGGGYYEQEEKKGSNILKFSGVELQPVNPDGTLISSSGSKADRQETQDAQKAIKDKLKRPPNFTQEQIMSIQSRFKTTPYREPVILTANSQIPADRSRGNDDEEGSSLKSKDELGMDLFLKSIDRDESKKLRMNRVYLLLFAAYSIVETLFIFSWANFGMSETLPVSYQTRALMVGLLMYDYIYGHFQRLSWLWMIIGLFARFCCRLTLAEALNKATPVENLFLWLVLYSSIRYLYLIFPDKGTKLIRASSILVFMIAFSLFAASSGILEIVAVRKISLQILKQTLSPFALSFGLYLLFEAEIFLAKMILSEEGSWYLPVIVTEEITSRILVVPFQIKKCRTQDTTLYKQMFPFVIVR